MNVSWARSAAIRNPRILLYSHDTFGLGHVRRNCKLANALAEAFPAAEIVIATGSEKAGVFPLAQNVRVVRLPRADKNADGSYSSGEKGISRDIIIAQRSRLIADTARALAPHLFIADKEPLGLLGELEETLDLLRAMGTRMVLGLRDVLDETDMLRSEWEKKGITRQLAHLYDTLWIYGPRDFHDPLSGIDLPESMAGNTHFLGFIAPAQHGEKPERRPGLPPSYILAMSGGGGDGRELMASVIAAYRRDPGIPHPPLLLLGPFMDPADQAQMRKDAAAIPGSIVLDFDAAPEALIANAAGVVAMCGYNTFCEVLSHDRPSLFIPREQPRLEQFIRAAKASALGLCTMVRTVDALADPAGLAAKLRALPDQTRPSDVSPRIDMSGLDAVKARAAEELAQWSAEEAASHAWS